jgi:hypothetical protein
VAPVVLAVLALVAAVVSLLLLLDVAPPGEHAASTAAKPALKMKRRICPSPHAEAAG